MNELDEVVEAMLPKYLAEHGHETRFVHEFVKREVDDSEGIRERIQDLLNLAIKDDLNKDVTVGTMYAKNALLLRVAVGEATSQETGIRYELSTSTDSSPMVKCLTTGKTWAMPWRDILDLAIEQGVSRE